METGAAVGTLTALAHETRLDVFRVLVKAGPGGLPAGSIAEKLAVPPPSLSFHLKELTHSGVIQRERQGRQVVYSADFAAMRELVSFLTEECCEGYGDSPEWSRH